MVHRPASGGRTIQEVPVSALLFRLGRNCARHPFRVIGAWLVVAIAVLSLQGAAGGEFEDAFRVPGVESQRAADVLNDRFPSRGGQSARVVLHVDTGRLDDTVHRTAVDQLRSSLSSGSDVASVTDPFATDSVALSPDGRTAYVDMTYTVDKLGPTHFDDATAAGALAEGAGVELELTGPLALLAEDEASSEVIGVAVAIVVLLVAFGSVVAMGLPIVTALFGLFVGASGVGVLSAVMDVPEFSLILCLMVGLGVGIDYALFIVTRHRQNLHDGMSVEDSAGNANATAGLAVLFAGTTVVIAILGLFVAGLPALTSMGVAVALVVVVAMLAAVTLLPGLLGLAGTRIDKLSIHRKGHVDKPAHATFAGRWAHHVGSHPKRYAALSLGALCLIALPVLSMRIGTPDDGNAPENTTQRAGYDLLADGFGKGFNGPIQVVMQVPTPADQVAVGRVHDALQADPGVAAVTPPVFNEAQDTALITVNPTTAPQDAATDTLVRHLRSDVLPAAVAGTDASALLTGQAMVTDLTERITSRLPWFIAAIVAMSFVLLMIVFRSVLVPLKAALMNLLSIAAAYGVIVAVFQWGWGNELIGVENTMPINPFAPLMMFAILFGLSMDYEVFLLSRVREEFVRTGDSHQSVVRGLSSTARVITSAALIMISVFASFVLGDDPTGKLFGVGLAVAVFLDATLVRMVLVPATMSLVGRANWWLPGWLDRILPHLDLEGDLEGDVEASGREAAGDGDDVFGRDADPDAEPERELATV
jgi:RND superfamily putative drug exporter